MAEWSIGIRWHTQHHDVWAARVRSIHCKALDLGSSPGNWARVRTTQQTLQSVLDAADSRHYRASQASRALRNSPPHTRAALACCACYAPSHAALGVTTSRRAVTRCKTYTPASTRRQERSLRTSPVPIFPPPPERISARDACIRRSLRAPAPAAAMAEPLDALVRRSSPAAAAALKHLA